MSLQAHAQRPDPELWRALHDAPNAPAHLSAAHANEQVRPLHGMPADRLAMAATRQPADLLLRQP